MDGVNRTVNRFFGAGCILDVKQAVVGETDQAAGRLWGECTIGRGESLLTVLACAGEGSGSESALSRMGESLARLGLQRGGPTARLTRWLTTV
jgi:hypothetical protein